METEEAALLHEEATMTIEELLARYGQNLNAVKHAAAIRYKFSICGNRFVFSICLNGR